MRFLATLPLLLPVTMAQPVPPAADRVVHPVAHPAFQPASRTLEAPRRADLVEALEVLHEWDARRARAWAAVDAAALRSLYVPGSGAGRADLRLLRAYADRGVVVRRIVTQVFAVQVLRSDAPVMRLRVFDRVAGGEVMHAGHEEALGSSRPAIRAVELRPGPVGWRVASVSGRVSGWVNGWGGGPREARR